MAKGPSGLGPWKATPSFSVGLGVGLQKHGFGIGFRAPFSAASRFSRFGSHGLTEEPQALLQVQSQSGGLLKEHIHLLPNEFRELPLLIDAKNVATALLFPAMI